MIAFERTPVDPIGKGRIISFQVQAIRIGEETVSVPPGTFMRLGTAAVSFDVIVVIFGGKLSTAGKKNPNGEVVTLMSRIERKYC